MWATLGREMATQVIYSKHLSSFRPELALKTLGSKPCQWQTKKNRQTGYYRFKATGNLWKPLETAGVSKCTEWDFHGAFHQNNVAQVCSCSSTLAQRSVMTSRVCHADIIPRIREAQKNNNKQQYGPVEIRCTLSAPFEGHYTTREICHFETSASSYQWMNLVVIWQSTLGRLSDRNVIINEGEIKALQQ